MAPDIWWGFPYGQPMSRRGGWSGVRVRVVLVLIAVGGIAAAVAGAA